MRRRYDRRPAGAQTPEGEDPDACCQVCHTKHLYKRLLCQARPYWAHIGGILLLGLLSTPLALLTPLPLKIAVDSVRWI